MPLAPQRHHAPHGLRILLSGKLTLQRDGEELYDDSFFVVLDIRQREKERKVLQVMIGKNRLHWAALSGEGIFFLNDFKHTLAGVAGFTLSIQKKF